MEKIRNWRLNREKLKLEVEKSRIEKEKLEFEKEIRRIELEEKVQKRGASRILYSLVERLERNPINLLDMEMQLDENEDEEDRVVFT